MAPRKKKTVEFNFPHPMDNDVLVGHGDTLQSFMDAWNNRETHPIHPVWMLTGPRGIGKATLAYKIAKMVYGNVGDFFIIDLDRNLDKDGKLKPDGKSISVFTVRAMIERMQMSSMSGQWRGRVEYGVVKCDSEIIRRTTGKNTVPVGGASVVKRPANGAITGQGRKNETVEHFATA